LCDKYGVIIDNESHENSERKQKVIIRIKKEEQRKISLKFIPRNIRKGQKNSTEKTI